MTDDPYVREIGRLAGGQGRELIVGVAYGTVTLRIPDTAAVTLGEAGAEEFGRLFAAACWAAARQSPAAGIMRDLQAGRGHPP